VTTTVGNSITFTASSNATGAAYYWHLPDGVKGINGKGADKEIVLFPMIGTYMVAVSSSPSRIPTPEAVAKIIVIKEIPVQTEPGRTVGGSTPAPVPGSTEPGRTEPARTLTGRSL
jgi:hypothetical protein